MHRDRSVKESGLRIMFVDQSASASTSDDNDNDNESEADKDKDAEVEFECGDLELGEGSGPAIAVEEQTPATNASSKSVANSEFCEGKTRKLYHDTNKRALEILQHQAKKVMPMFPTLQSVMAKTLLQDASSDEFLEFERQHSTPVDVNAKAKGKGKGKGKAIANANTIANGNGNGNGSGSGNGFADSEQARTIFTTVESGWATCTSLATMFDEEMATAVAAFQQRPRPTSNSNSNSKSNSSTNAESSSSSSDSASASADGQPHTHSKLKHVLTFKHVQRSFDAWRSCLVTLKQHIQSWMGYQAALLSTGGDNAPSKEVCWVALGWWLVFVVG